jgi:hypothetical protein
MNTLVFTGEMARLQQAIAGSHDLVVRRGIVLQALNARTESGYWSWVAAAAISPPKLPDL